MVTDNSKTHINPADYFDPNAPIPERPLTSKYFYPITFPAFGVLVCVAVNYFNRRPIWSGFHRHIIASGIGVITGFATESFHTKMTTRKDDKIYHYIITHPEDFPPIERVKYKDMLQSWSPVR